MAHAENLGVRLDSSFSHIPTSDSSASPLSLTSKIPIFQALFTDSTATILLSHLDYCKSLLTGLLALVLFSNSLFSTQQPDRTFQNVSQLILTAPCSKPVISHCRVKAHVLAIAYKVRHHLVPYMSSANSLPFSHFTHITLVSLLFLQYTKHHPRSP